MSKIFFKVGSTDFSSAVDIRNFDVNNVEVAESWTDANWIEHRTVVRTRVEGRVVLGYASATDFATAVSTISTALSTNGYASCTVLCNNDGTTHTVDCYLTIRGTGEWDEINSRQWQTLEIQIRQR